MITLTLFVGLSLQNSALFPHRSSHATPAARAPQPETKAEQRKGHPLLQKPASGAHLPTRRRRKGQGRYQGHSQGRGQGRRKDAGGEAGRGRREGNPLQGHEGHDPTQGQREGRHLSAGQGEREREGSSCGGPTLRGLYYSLCKSINIEICRLKCV